ncbi:unnamed protein product [Discula destructiva]
MSLHQRVLITGATGNQGGGCVRHCLKAGHTVHALVRDPTAPAAKTLQNLGAKLVKGDFNDETSLAAAMRDVEAVVFIHPDLSDYESDVQRATKVINAAQAAESVKTMIASTAFGVGSHKQLKGWGSEHPMYHYWRLKDTVENLVRDAGFATWTILRPSHLLQLFQPPARDFVFPGLMSDHVLRTAFEPTTRIPWLDGRDVGLAVAAALTAPEKFAGRELGLVAEELTIAEVGARIEEASDGKSVKVHYYSKQEAEEVVAKGLGIIITSQRWANEVAGFDDGDLIEGLSFTSALEYFKQAKLI